MQGRLHKQVAKHTDDAEASPHASRGFSFVASWEPLKCTLLNSK